MLFIWLSLQSLNYKINENGRKSALTISWFTETVHDLYETT